MHGHAADKYAYRRWCLVMATMEPSDAQGLIVHKSSQLTLDPKLL